MEMKLKRLDIINNDNIDMDLEANINTNLFKYNVCIRSYGTLEWYIDTTVEQIQEFVEIYSDGRHGLVEVYTNNPMLDMMITGDWGCMRYETLGATPYEEIYKGR